MTPLAIAHLLFQAAIAAYLGVGHGCLPALLVVLLGVLTGHLLHRGMGVWSDRLFARELVVGLAAIASWGLLHPPLYPFIGMLATCFVLHPPRHASLRWLVALAAADLIVIGSQSGRTGLHPPVEPALAAAFDVSLALAAVAADAWMGSSSLARGLRGDRKRLHAALRWLLPPSLLALLLGLTLGLPLAGRDPASLPPSELRVNLRRVQRGTDLADNLTVGTINSAANDLTVSARLDWSDEGLGNRRPPIPPQFSYLRAMALGNLRVDGAFLLWSADGTKVPASERRLPAAPHSWLIRAPGSGDVVLRPDGCREVAMTNMLEDREANLFRSQIGMQLSTYRVSLEAFNQDETGPAPEAEEQLKPYRSYPSALALMPWEEIEEAAWRHEDPETAASRISHMLRLRCRYALENIPDPDPRQGGAISRFLFDPDPSLRRGHCQYFATSAVLLLRRAGHASRCVVGFASDESDPAGVTFRGLHAHAWAEVVNSRGQWQRFDPTPSASRQISKDYLKQDRVPSPPELRKLAEDEARSRARKDSRLRSLGYAAIALLSGWLLWRWLRRPRGRALELARLARQGDGLIQLAVEFGFRVTPSTTLVQAVRHLEERSGLDLGPILKAHLDARFGTGPLPPGWPLQIIRTQARQRAEAAAGLTARR